MGGEEEARDAVTHAVLDGRSGVPCRHSSDPNLSPARRSGISEQKVGGHFCHFCSDGVAW